MSVKTDFITSPKQNLSYLEATHRFNLWVGAVRSGKTFSSIRKFIDRIKYGVPGDAMIIGVNRGTIQRNILSTLYKTLGFPVPSPMSNKGQLFGRDIHFIGAPDVSAVTTIQGSTLAYAYVDEAVAVPEAFWKMLESRLSIKGAQLFATCNPDTPTHWLKKQYIDRPDVHDIGVWNFNLDDNPILDDTYKKAITSSYTGVWYRRFIKGEWCAATGAVFPDFDHDNIYTHPKSNPTYYLMGIDYGTTNPTAALLCSITPNEWPQMKVEEEYYYDSSVTGMPKTDAQFVVDIKRFIGRKDVRSIYIDPAAASLKIALRNENLPVLDGNNDVLLGIKTMSKFISGKNIVVQKACKNTIEQIQSYTWDGKATERGEDKPLKKNDHCVDALKYCLSPFMLSGDFGHADENLTIENIRRNVYGENSFGFINPEIGGGYF